MRCAILESDVCKVRDNIEQFDDCDGHYVFNMKHVFDKDGKEIPFVLSDRCQKNFFVEDVTAETRYVKERNLLYHVVFCDVSRFVSGVVFVYHVVCCVLCLVSCVCIM